MLFELRQYRVRPGQRDNWVKFADEVMIPFQQSRGMTIVGSWIADAEDDLFVWIRRFESEEERQRLYKEVYDSDRWKSDIGPRVRELVDLERMKVTRLTPTPRSNLR
jgi:hypothetical protein